MTAKEPVGHVYRYGKDSHGREWHGVHWYNPNLDVPDGTKLYTTPQPTEASEEACRAEAQKQIVMLREALDELATLMDDVIAGNYKPDSFTCQPARKALDATDDLKDCILCDAEPRSYLYRHNSAFGDGDIWSHRPLHNGKDAIESLPLYKARRLK